MKGTLDLAPTEPNQDALNLVNLLPLMHDTEGDGAIMVGLIDGPVDLTHPDLAPSNVRALSTANEVPAQAKTSVACEHGTMVAGILFARRGSGAPSICPGCSIISRPIFSDSLAGSGGVPSTDPPTLAQAIVETVKSGAHVINLSLGVASTSDRHHEIVTHALNFAASRGTLVIAASGNQTDLRGSCVTQHRWVIPVSSCDQSGRPSAGTTLSASVGQHGLRAPGQNVFTFSPAAGLAAFDGSSAACAFVTGAAALLLSLAPNAPREHVRRVLTQSPIGRRASVVPPLLNAAASYALLTDGMHVGRATHLAMRN